MLNDAVHTAKINGVVYCTCEYSTKTNISDSWIVAPRVQSTKNEGIVSGQL